MNFNSRSIDFKMGYLAGSLYYDWETEDYTLDEFIVKANELIEFNGIPLDIDVAEYVCEIYSSIKGRLKYEENEYVVIDEEHAVYIKDNLIVVEDDEELVEKLNGLLDEEEEKKETCFKCEIKIDVEKSVGWEYCACLDAHYCSSCSPTNTCSCEGDGSCDCANCDKEAWADAKQYCYYECFSTKNLEEEDMDC